MKALLTVLSAALTTILAVPASAQEPEDIFANMPDYTLKEGSVGSPRTDIPWIRVCRSTMADGKKKSICQMTATVQRSFDAFNRMSHTEFIAEVVLEKSDRPVVKEELVVIHSDRWSDLIGEKVNPFAPGSTILIDARGDPKDLASLEFTIQKSSPNKRPEGTPGKAPSSKPSQVPGAPHP